jgi:hypothetical protein
MHQEFPIAKAKFDVKQNITHTNLVFMYFTWISYAEYNPLFLNYTVRYIATNLKSPVMASHCFCPTCAVLDARVHRSLLPYVSIAREMLGSVSFYGSCKTYCMLVRCCVLQIVLGEVLWFIDFESYRRVSDLCRRL